MSTASWILQCHLVQCCRLCSTRRLRPLWPRRAPMWTSQFAVPSLWIREMQRTAFHDVRNGEVVHAVASWQSAFAADCSVNSADVAEFCNISGWVRATFVASSSLTSGQYGERHVECPFSAVRVQASTLSLCGPIPWPRHWQTLRHSGSVPCRSRALFFHRCQPWRLFCRSVMLERRIVL
mmetsp:Transcript_41364/g.109590  ORF Transcript_41364/g.109590 Transcript_41364/m.109590 type:complete len:180 (+) Transcript_41364:672-1211(+)